MVEALGDGWSVPLDARRRISHDSMITVAILVVSSMSYYDHHESSSGDGVDDLFVDVTEW